MGMFDTIRVFVPLPEDGRTTPRTFQTKDTPAQMLDLYELRSDGTLWHQDYDVEDQSDPNANGLKRFLGMATPVNLRWVPEPLTGEVVFGDGRSRYRAAFVEGKLRSLSKIF